MTKYYKFLNEINFPSDLRKLSEKDFNKFRQKNLENFFGN